MWLQPLGSCLQQHADSNFTCHRPGNRASWMLAGMAQSDPPEVSYSTAARTQFKATQAKQWWVQMAALLGFHSVRRRHLRHRRWTCLWLCLGVSGWSVLSQACFRLDLHDLPLGVAPSHQQHGLKLIHYVVGTSLSLRHVRSQGIHRSA